MNYRLIKKWSQSTREYSNYLSGIQVVWIGNKKECIKKMLDTSFNEGSEPMEKENEYIIHGDFDLIVEEIPTFSDWLEANFDNEKGWKLNSKTGDVNNRGKFDELYELYTTYGGEIYLN